MAINIFYLFIVYFFNQNFELYQQLYKLTILNDENKQHKASNVFQKIF